MSKLREDSKQTELKLEKRRCGDGRRSRQIFKDRDKNGCNEESQWSRLEKANMGQGREEAGLRNLTCKETGKRSLSGKAERNKYMGAKKN